MSDTRNANMEKRRRRIIAEAHTMLAEGGFERLNLRDLATAADVTVPTVYNLIGNKEALLKALTLGSMETYENELAGQLPCPAADLPGIMADVFSGMISRQGAYFRATVLANERLEAQREKPGDFGFRRDEVRKILKTLFQQSRDEGLLKGEIDHRLLIDQAVVIQEVALRDWAHRLISRPAFHRRLLAGLYTSLYCDATAAYRASLTDKLRAL